MKTSASLFLTDILPHKRKFFNRVVKNKVFAHYQPRQVFGQLKKSGIDGIELLLPSYNKITHDDIIEVKKYLDTYKIPVLSVHQALRFFSKTRMNEIAMLFSFADQLHAKVIVLHLSTAGKQVFNKDYIETLHSLQKKYNIKVGFENREKFVLTQRSKHGWDAKRFSGLMKQNNFNITLDTTHLAQAGGDIITFFKDNKDRIVNIHLSDYKKHILNSTIRPFRFKHMPLGKGQLPIEDFLKTLKKEKYKGIITMEIHTDLNGMCEGARKINSIAKN